MMVWSNIISYLKAGSLLHFVTLLEIILISFFFYVLKLEKWLTDGNIILRSITLLPVVLLPLLAQLDARSRYQNYKQVKDILFSKGFQPRIIKLYSKTRCQRCAALTAAEELGMAKICKNWFYDQGYRWYHFFPDFIFSNPRYLICKAFWSNTFFAKKYKSKFSFRFYFQIQKALTVAS